MVSKQRGFTLIELIIVIVILGILTVVAAPRFIDISSDAKISVLNGIAGNIRSTVSLVQHKARIKGLTTTSTNPGTGQSELIVDFGFAETELYFGNLCPEAESELGDAVDFFEFMEISSDENLLRRTDNQYALIGYDVPSSGVPTDQGCYVIYDSFAEPNCTVEVVDIDC
ncbi:MULTISPECIES: prepilin-type N-terminal cleavage/methylation domain-containing protein [Alteromonadaceae]|uniref:prepilin-type N-terminal cleavage/methylation domain-containing protein n=1 Tax=Alteromonadaceae TaxID=72275 RepID=UPI0031072AB9